MSSPLLVGAIESEYPSKGLITLENIIARDYLCEERPTFSISFHQLYSLKDPIAFLSSLSYEQQVALIAIPPSPIPDSNGVSSLIHDRLHAMIPVFPALKELIAEGRKPEEGGPTFRYFPLISRARHSCLPNAVLAPQRDGSYILQATQHIAKGSQIYLSYLPPDSASLPYDRRRTFLNLPFLHPSAAHCFCSSCQIPPSQRQPADSKRVSLYDAIHTDRRHPTTKAEGAKGRGGGGPKFVAETVEQIASLVEQIVVDEDQTSLRFFLVDLAREAAQMLFMERDFTRALEWAWLATRLAEALRPGDVPMFRYYKEWGRAASIVPLAPLPFRLFVRRLLHAPKHLFPSSKPSLIESIIFLPSDSLPPIPTLDSHPNDPPPALTSSPTTNVLDDEGSTSSGSTYTLTGDPLVDEAEAKAVVEVESEPQTDASSDPSLPPPPSSPLIDNTPPISPTLHIPGSFSPPSIPIVPSINPTSLDTSSSKVEPR